MRGQRRFKSLELTIPPKLPWWVKVIPPTTLGIGRTLGRLTLILTMILIRALALPPLISIRGRPKGKRVGRDTVGCPPPLPQPRFGFGQASIALPPAGASGPSADLACLPSRSPLISFLVRDSGLVQVPLIARKMLLLLTGPSWARGLVRNICGLTPPLVLCTGFLPKVRLKSAEWC